MKASYSSQYQALWRQHWWWQSRHRTVMRALQDVCKSDGHSREHRRLLDIGCAGGVAFDDFSSFGAVQGVEPDARLVDCESSWASKIEVVKFDHDYQTGYRPDVVLVLDVLEHIEDDAAALALVYQLLAPGGSAILTVPALPSLWSAHDEVNLHFRRYTRTGLRNLAVSAGFEVKTLRYLFGWPLPLMYARRLIAGPGREDYAVHVPPPPINALFRCLTSIEERIGGVTRMWPVVGSSLLAVVRRPGGTGSCHEPVDSAGTTEFIEQTEAERVVLSRHQAG